MPSGARQSRTTYPSLIASFPFLRLLPSPFSARRAARHSTPGIHMAKQTGHWKPAWTLSMLMRWHRERISSSWLPPQTPAMPSMSEAKAIERYPGSIMSQSFGIPEIQVHGNNAQIIQAEKNYEAAAAAGITVLASAGDSGATNGFSAPNALFPSSDPLVVAVGGTEGNPYPGGLVGCSIPSQTCKGEYGGEQVWNEPQFAAATGGAPSLFFGVPSYQNGLGLKARTTPDVSYNAAVNGGVLVYTTFLGSPILFIVGGTSAGSPQWAAIFALANQLAGKALGFINPVLYSLAQSTASTLDFHDITKGNNQLV